MNEPVLCEYCHGPDDLTEVPDKWVINENLDVVLTNINFGAYVFPLHKCLTVYIDNANLKTLLSKEIPIKFCPMCGREL